MGLIVGTVVVVQILSADVQDHLTEYATFKAIGFTNRYLLGVIAEQSMVLTVAGFIPGFLVSLGGYELVRRAIAQCDHEPELYGPALSEWLKGFLDRAVKNPRQPVGQLMAPRTKQLRPSNEVELVYSLSLSQEAYYRVRKAIEAGRSLKRAFNDVARELNALGYRNANQAPLRAASIERRYYEVHRTKRG